GAARPATLGFVSAPVTRDTRAKAREAGRHFVWRMGPTLRGPVEWFAPVGMRSKAGKQFALTARPRALDTMVYAELLAAHFIIAGTPDEVAVGFARVHQELGVGHLLVEAQESRMDHATTMRSIELVGAKVIPALARPKRRRSEQRGAPRLRRGATSRPGGMGGPVEAPMKERS